MESIAKSVKKEGREVSSKEGTSWSRDRHVAFRFSHDILKEKAAEVAKKVSAEEFALLEIDIFKPLDFYGILFKKRQTSAGPQRESKTQATERQGTNVCSKKE